jgi:hypothetical protein
MYIKSFSLWNRLGSRSIALLLSSALGTSEYVESFLYFSFLKIHFVLINWRVTGEWQLPPWCNHHDNRRTQSTGRWWGLFKRLLSCSSLHERIQVSAVIMFEFFYNFVIYFEFVVEFAVVSTLFRHSSGMSTTHIRKMSVLSWNMSDSTMVTPKDYLSPYQVSKVELL